MIRINLKDNGHPNGSQQSTLTKLDPFTARFARFDENWPKRKI